MDKGLYVCLNKDMSEKNDYFEYVSQVLGVKSILNDLQATSSSEAVPLLIAVEGYSSYDDNEKDLLTKMISALKIDQKNIKVADLQNVVNYQAQFYIYFTDAQSEQNSTAPNLVQTHSPKFLLKNADYKKNAWNDLQKVIAYFKQSNWKSLDLWID